MHRLQALEVVLDHLAAQRAELAVRAAADVPGRFRHALTGFAAFMAGDPETLSAAAAAARRAPGSGPVDDPVDYAVDDAVAAAVDVLEVAVGRIGGTEADAALTCVRETAARTTADDRLSAFARYLAIEASMAAAQLDLAAAVASSGAAPRSAWAGHPYAGVMLACEARVATFTGDVTGALRLLDHAPAYGGLPGALVRATHVLAAANAADLPTTERLVAETLRAGIEPTDHPGRGVHLLLAFGTIALGQVDDAVGHLLRAGGGPDLAMLTVIDRAISFEILVNAAVTADDLEAARAWEARAQVWEDHRTAAPSVLRTRSRVALLAGDLDAAEQLARRAVDAAAADNRVIERAEGEIVLARARIAAKRVGEATRDLRAAVASSDSAGHLAMRRAATRELRPARRRLPPPSGAGWESLSARERDVAALVMAGVDNAGIAAALHLSPATVRTHVTRVLSAYGVATRIGLLAASRERPDPAVRPDDLTARQADVAELVALGRTNAQVAAALGVQPRTVEKYLSQVLERWGVATRFDLARHWWSLQSP